MKPNRLFSEIYKIDESTNLYMIEIALDQYGDVFNEWDPAPFKRRDIDPDLQLYLEGSTNEIPLRYPIELNFTIPQGTKNQQIEEDLRGGLKNCFTFKLYLLRKELKEVNTRMLRFILIGFLLLWVATKFSEQFEGAPFASVLAEGLFIGGWVFIWEAVSLFFFTNRELYEDYRTYKRLLKAPVFFRETEREERYRGNHQTNYLESGGPASAELE
jgi:hypothetical protein